MKSNLLKRSDKQTRVWFVGQLTCCKSVCLFECPSGRLSNPHNERHLHLTLQWEGKIRKSFHPYLEIHSSNSEQWSLHRAGKKSKQLFCATYTSASQHGKSNGVSKELYLSRHTKQSPDRKKVTVVMNIKFCEYHTYYLVDNATSWRSCSRRYINENRNARRNQGLSPYQNSNNMWSLSRCS